MNKINHDKLILYKGKKSCSENKSYEFVMYIEKNWYKIMAET